MVSVIRKIQAAAHFGVICQSRQWTFLRSATLHLSCIFGRQLRISLEARDLDQEETFALYAKGRDKWNAWANALLEERRALEATPPDLNGTQDNMAAWLAKARADFSAQTLILSSSTHSKSCEEVKVCAPVEDGITASCRTLDGANFDFNGFVFPSDVTFRGTRFQGNALFQQANFMGMAQFLGTRFGQSAEFYASRFDREAAFNDAQFADAASFRAARFEGGASFISAQFKVHARFEDAQFSKCAYFSSASFGGQAAFNTARFRNKVTVFNAAQFVGDAWFKGANFNNALFEDARFCGAAHFDGKAEFFGTARFLQARFEGYTTFREARFYDAAVFRGISVDRVFDLDGARFNAPPDFHAARFAEAPRLDNLTIPLPCKSLGFGLAWRCLKAGRVLPIIRQIRKRGVPLLRPDDFTAHFRALRRLAIQGHDYDNERRFLKGEILSRRFALDGRLSFALWLGVAYDSLSDFGSSMSRPVYWWAWSAMFFALLYSCLAFPGTCGGGFFHTLFGAIYISLKNSLLLISWGSDAGIGKVTACLNEANDMNFWRAFALDLIRPVQKIWSAALWFLFLLAIRNRFKIK